jgi:outer membrane murein-binding lipoprotein Lpp
MTGMLRKSVVGAVIVSLAFVTGCAAKRSYEIPADETKTAQAEKVPKDAEAKIRTLQRELAATREAAEKERKALSDNIEELTRDLAASKETTAKALKDAADKIKQLEVEVSAAKEAATKAEKDAEARPKGR